MIGLLLSVIAFFVYISNISSQGNDSEVVSFVKESNLEALNALKDEEIVNVNLLVGENYQVEEDIGSLISGDMLSEGVDINSASNGMTFIFNNKGEYQYIFEYPDRIVTYNINVEYKEVDLVSMESEIEGILGGYADQFSINLYDFKREVEWNYNKDKIVEPASIAKLPIAMLVMRDIDSGKYTLQETYPIYNSQKFSFSGNIGSLSEGTEVTIDYYLSNLLSMSDNNAWYILTYFLGGNWEVVNPRTINELGINPLFLDPPQGTAKNVGKLLKQLYTNEGISKESSEYILRKLGEAGDWAKAGVGLGLPEGITYYNKIGTLLAGDKYSYQDAALVYGAYTDYSLVIMDEYIDWDLGQVLLKDISSVVYRYLN